MLLVTLALLTNALIVPVVLVTPVLVTDARLVKVVLVTPALLLAIVLPAPVVLVPLVLRLALARPARPKRAGMLAVERCYCSHGAGTLVLLLACVLFAGVALVRVVLEALGLPIALVLLTDVLLIPVAPVTLVLLLGGGRRRNRRVGRRTFPPTSCW